MDPITKCNRMLLTQGRGRHGLSHCNTLDHFYEQPLQQPCPEVSRIHVLTHHKTRTAAKKRYRKRHIRRVHERNNHISAYFANYP